jgi:Ni/Co efflux regulator RcnB
MKKLAMAAVAIMTAAAPIMTATPAAAHERDRDRGDWRDRDRGDWRDRDHDRRGRWDRDDRRDHRRHNRRERWERRQHNGYYYRDRFFYGPPPGHYYDDPYYRPGYRAWRRGDRLPPYYRSNYGVVRNYGRYGLRHPPRGYHWVHDDRGGYLLVGIATGVILGLALGSSGY